MEATQDGGNPLHAWSERIADLVENLGRHVIAVHVGRHESVTGLIWRAGTVVTVAHALPRASDISLTLPDGASVKAQLAGADGSTDLAVLRIDEEKLEPVREVDDAAVRTGNWVLAVARGGHGDLAVDHGLIGRVGPAWQTWRGGRIDRLIRLDGGLGAGFSGAPVADARGKVIGIGTSALARAHQLDLYWRYVGRASLMSKSFIRGAELDRWRAVSRQTLDAIALSPSSRSLSAFRQSKDSLWALEQGDARELTRYYEAVPAQLADYEEAWKRANAAASKLIIDQPALLDSMETLRQLNRSMAKQTASLIGDIEISVRAAS